MRKMNEYAADMIPTRLIVSIAVVIAGVSLILGIIARLTMMPLGPLAIRSQAFLRFTDTCLLVAILCAVLQLVKAKT